MRLIIILLIALFIGILLYVSLKNKLNKKNAIILGVLFGIFGLFAGIYTHFLDAKNKSHIDIINAFERGVAINCDNINVSKEHFNFINGTLSFVGKKGGEFHNKVISIDKCKITQN